ncbi:MAG: homoserine dehydrogenase [Verrucomicrobiales bacterium]|jgi:homoserine dehydrogenase
MPASKIARTLNIGLAGLGNVGAGVYKNLDKNRVLLNERTSADLVVKKIAVRDPTRKRDVDVPAELITTRLLDLVEDDGIDVIVELIGGTEEAYDFVKAALEAGKPVVTGNKALLAEHGKELIELAEEKNVPLYCEAAVAGGIPIIKAVKEALVGNKIEAIYGIINGTSNFILSQMADGMAFDEALAEATRLGYAEADPTLDVNGWDAGHKAIILAWLSYGFWIKPGEVSVKGIEDISPIDVEFADYLDYDIKLLGVIRQDDDGQIEVRVEPSLIPQSHILSSVGGVFNAVLVHGDVVGETLFYGSGAGQDATSSAVISDLADVVENITNGVGASGFIPHGDFGKAKPIGETVSQYYLRLTVDDTPGVLAQIAKVLGDNGVGILSVIQPEVRDSHDGAPLVLTLHDSKLGTVEASLAEITKLDSVRDQPTLIRVEPLRA